VSSVAFDSKHGFALAEDGLVYAWGGYMYLSALGSPHEKQRPLPTPVEALRGVRVESVAAAGHRSYAVADTGEVWAWGGEGEHIAPLGHGEQTRCPLPKPIESLRGVKVEAVVAGFAHTLALADDGSAYVWGRSSFLGLGPSVKESVYTPRRIPALLVACRL
jgi:hypothetical protein